MAERHLTAAARGEEDEDEERLLTTTATRLEEDRHLPLGKSLSMQDAFDLTIISYIGRENAC